MAVTHSSASPARSASALQERTLSDVYKRISTPSRSWRTAGLCRHRLPSGDGPRPGGDPTGAATGTAKDVTVKDAANPTLAEVMETVGHNKISINFVWTLVCRLPRHVHAGRVRAWSRPASRRAKNAAHTMSMNFMVYALGMLGYWVCGFALQMGGVGAVAVLGGTPPLSHEFTITLVRQDVGPVRHERLLPERQHVRRRRVRAVPVPDGVHGHGRDDPHRRDGRALEVLGVLRLRASSWAAFIYPDLRQLGVGRRLAGAAGLELRPRPRPRRLRRLLASCTWWAASRRWPAASCSGRASASTTRTGKANAIAGAPHADGVRSARSSWRSAGSASTRARRSPAPTCASPSSPPTRCSPRLAARFAAMLYMWMRVRQARPGMMCNGMLAGLVAITAPCAFVTAPVAVLIGAHRRRAGDLGRRSSSSGR